MRLNKTTANDEEVVPADDSVVIQPYDCYGFMFNTPVINVLFIYINVNMLSVTATYKLKKTKSILRIFVGEIIML